MDLYSRSSPCPTIPRATEDKGGDACHAECLHEQDRDGERHDETAPEDAGHHDARDGFLPRRDGTVPAPVRQRRTEKTTSFQGSGKPGDALAVGEDGEEREEARSARSAKRVVGRSGRRTPIAASTSAALPKVNQITRTRAKPVPFLAVFRRPGLGGPITTPRHRLGNDPGSGPHGAPWPRADR